MSDILRVYGISNCDTVKRARAWLDSHHIAFQFHDFKKAGLDAAQLERWLTEADWQVLLNRAGATWRKLPEARRLKIGSSAAAATLMLEQPSIIKRPVMEIRPADAPAGLKLLVGFDPERYRTQLLDK